MRHILTLALALFATVASAATFTVPQPFGCIVHGADVLCDSVPNDAGQVIDFDRKVIPQVYLGNGLYQPAYSIIQANVDGVTYATQPFAYSVVSTATSLSDWNEVWSGTAYSAGGLPLTFNVQMHKHKKTCSGRGCGGGFTYQLLGGGVQ